jgi:hypothetical protein
VSGPKKSSNVVDFVDLGDYVDGVAPEASTVETESRPARALAGARELRRLVKNLQRADLSRTARRIVELLKARTAELQGMLEALEDRPAFSPIEAGLALVTAMQAAEGGAWTGKDLQERFKLSPATLHRKRKEHRILYWRDSRHEFYYPKWQFTPTGALLPGMQEILQTFDSDDEWRVMRYFLGEREQLGARTPLDLLRAGETGKVLAHARAHAEENTW